VPLVVRMKGSNEDLGKKILKDSGLPIISADNMAQAGQRVVAAIVKKKNKSVAKRKAKLAKKMKPVKKKAKRAAKKRKKK